MVTRVPVKGIKRYRSKGVWYYYHRATGTRLKAEFGTAEFVAEVAALDRKVVRTDAKPGTLAALVAKYKETEFWTALAPATKLSYDRALGCLKGIMAMPLKDFDPEFVAGLRDKVAQKHRKWMANYVVTVLGILFDTALENGWVQRNPTESVRRLKKDKDRAPANRPWDWQECRTVLDEAPPYLRVPIALAMLGGFRKGDVLTITKDRIADGRVNLRTKKTGKEVTLPVHPTLANVLAAAPKHAGPTIAANSRGEAWTESGFNSTFGKLIDRLETEEKVKPGLTMHGLRHTMGERLAEAGADLETIKDVLGQKTLVMAQHYSKTADRSDRVDAALSKVRILEPKTRTKSKRRAV